MREKLSQEEKNIRSGLNLYDIIKIAGNKYLIIDLKKSKVTLFPIDLFLLEESNNKTIPKINLKYETLEGYQEVDQTELLYLLNEKNSFIKKALDHLLYERK